MKRTSMASPFDLWGASLQMGYLLAEAQSVIAMRLWGMAGVWNVTASERTRMVDEKPAALTQAAMNAAFAAMRGERPDQIVTSAIRPLRAKTRSNARRLAKRGLKLK